MLYLIPRHLPPLGVILDDIGRPPAPELARALGVSVSTVRRWLADPDQVPRLPLLALFWVSRWGQSAVDAETFNSAREAWGLVMCQRTELEALRVDFGRLLALADTGAANGASWRHLPVAAVIEFRPMARR